MLHAGPGDLMRILIQTLGSAGDTYPYLGIGARLLARGHDVHVLANEEFADAVRATGAEFVECGTSEDYRRTIEDPDLWDPRKGLETVMRGAFLPVLETAYDLLRERVLPGETVIVTGIMGFSARMVWETEGVPLVTAHLAPSAFRSGIHPPRFPGMPHLPWMPSWYHSAVWWLVDKIIDRVVCPEVNAFRSSVGLPPVSRVFHDWTNAGTRLVGLFPEWFAPVPADWPRGLELLGFPLFDDGGRREPDPELDAWLAGGDPPVLFTAGSANVHGREFFAESVRAATAAGLRALLVTRNPEVVPDPLPDGSRHAAYVPFGEVLPRAAAFVHHGGIGTSAQALACGTPQLVVPMGFDQYDNAAHVEALGVGLSIPSPRYRADRAADALARLVGSAAVREACERFASLARGGDPVERVCDIIEGALTG